MKFGLPPLGSQYMVGDGKKSLFTFLYKMQVFSWEMQQADIHLIFEVLWGHSKWYIQVS